MKVATKCHKRKLDCEQNYVFKFMIFSPLGESLDFEKETSRLNKDYFVDE